MQAKHRRVHAREITRLRHVRAVVSIFFGQGSTLSEIVRGIWLFWTLIWTLILLFPSFFFSFFRGCVPQQGMSRTHLVLDVAVISRHYLWRCRLQQEAMMMVLMNSTCHHLHQIWWGSSRSSFFFLSLFLSHVRFILNVQVGVFFTNKKKHKKQYYNPLLFR